MSQFSSLFLTFSLVLVLIVRGEFYTKSSGVVNLDSTNFDKTVAVNEGEVQIIEFYAPWCGHCKQLKPEYIKLAKSTKNLIKVYAVDANEEKNKAIAGKYGIKGFPTLKIHIGTGPPEDYTGPRDATSMYFTLKQTNSPRTKKITHHKRKQFLMEKMPNYAKKVSSKNLNRFLSNNKKLAHALVISKKPTTSAAVKRFSAIFKDYIIIGDVSKKDSSSIAKQFNIGSISNQGSTLLMFAIGDIENPTIFQGNTKSFREVQQWLLSFAPGLQLPGIGNDKLPLILDQSCFVEKCSKKGLCVILIKGEDNEDYMKTHTILKEIEENNDQSSLFAFSQININDENYEWLQNLFGNIDTFYSNIIILAPQKKRYAHYIGSMTYDAVKGFINGILTGKTRTSKLSVDEIPLLSTDTEHCKQKSKPKPKPKPKQSNVQPGGGSQYIVSVTAQNMQQVLFGNNQPLMVEFYAPWCGHCKKLAPEFAKAADKIKGMVLFATVNCDDEELKPVCGQFGIKGYPTLKVFPVGREEKQRVGPSDFQGRTAKEIEAGAVRTFNSVKIPILKNVEEYELYVDSEADAKILLFSSKKKAPILLKALAGAFDTVLFAMIVVSDEGNELVELLSVESFPSVYGYRTELSDAELYTGEKSFIDLTQFVVKMAEVGFKRRQQQAPEESIEEEDDDTKYDL